MPRSVGRCPSCGEKVEVREELTVAEAAERMGVSDQAVRNWIEQGKLPGSTREQVPGGFRWWCPIVDLDQLAKERARVA